MTIPTMYDPSLAPPADNIMESSCSTRLTLCGKAPGRPSRAVLRPRSGCDRGVCAQHRSIVIDKQVLTPLDLERRFGITGGNIFHGE